jgi:DNA-binding HxlR family transcriptional regulator
MVTINKSDVLDERNPARRVLSLIGDKWTPIILYCLSSGASRFSELEHRMPDISKKMLIQVLRKLESRGLVNRKVYPVVPPKTEYCLTATGKALHEPVAALCQWARTHKALLDKIERWRPPDNQT